VSSTPDPLLGSGTSGNFDDAALEVTECHRCHTPLVEPFTKLYPEARGGDTEPHWDGDCLGSLEARGLSAKCSC
jgi:hypothetical protein